MGSIVSGITDAIGLTSVGSTKYAARRAADEARAASERAADEMRFRPQNVTTRFGQSNFGFDPETERLTSAEYTLTPELADLQNRLIGITPGALERGLDAYNRIRPLEEAVPTLFGLSTEFLGESPQAIRQRYIDDQLAALEPGRIREEQRLGASVFGRGRAGLSVGDIGNPDLYSLAAARRQQELGLAAGAEDAVRQRIATGTGLLGQGVDFLNAVPAYQVAALSPFQTSLGLAQTIEELGQQPLSLGMQLGGAAAQAGSNVGRTLLEGGLTAAQTRAQGTMAANQQLNSFMQGMFNSGMSMYGARGGGASRPSWENEPWM